MDATSTQCPQFGFISLSPDMSKNATFPVGCTVLQQQQQVGYAQEAGTKFLLGIVEEVGISFTQDKGLCYKVRQACGTRHLCCSEDLHFAPRTLVFLSLKAGDETFQRNAVILSSQHEPSSITTSLRYTVQVNDKNSGRSMTFSNVSPKDLVYRPKNGKLKSTEDPPSADRPIASSIVGAKTGAGGQRYSGPPTPTFRHSTQVTRVLTKTRPQRSIKNNQPNPFQNIWREGARHQNAKAMQELVRLSGNGTYPDLPLPFCFDYHLRGYCNKGVWCSRSNSHKDLSPTEAKKVEMILLPVTSPAGPIYTPPTFPARTIINHQRSPFQRILVGANHHFGSAFQGAHLDGDSFVCLGFHLNGICAKGPQCPYRHTHRDLTPEEARTIENAFAPVMGHNGPIYTKPPSNGNDDINSIRKRHGEWDDSRVDSPSGPDNSNKRRCSNIPIKSETICDPKWTPPSPPPQPSNAPTLESAEPHTKATKRYAVPPSLGYAFFQQVVIGTNGEVARALGRKYSCNISLPAAYKSQDGRTYLSVIMVGKHEKSLVDCSRELEVLMVNAMERDLRAFLFFRLAVLNSLYKTEEKHIKRVSTSCGLDFGVGIAVKYMAFVNPGGKSDSNKCQASVAMARGKLEALRVAHPQCCIELFVYSQNFPRIRPFLFIGSPKFHLVNECRLDVWKQCCGYSKATKSF